MSKTARTPPGVKLAFEAMKIEGWLRAFVWKYVRNKADVDDVLQEVYVRLLMTRTEVESVRGFAGRCARNICFDHLRHVSVLEIESMGDLDALEVEDAMPGPEESMEIEQSTRILLGALGELPDRCREAAVLRNVYGYSQKEIAFSMRCAENTVEQHLRKALIRLEQRFENPCNGGPEPL